MDGSGKVWSPRSHGEAAGVTCFAFMLPKNQVPAVRLVRRNRGGHCTESPTRESRLYFFWASHVYP